MVEMRKSRREAVSGHKRELILDAAKQIFAEDGLDPWPKCGSASGLPTAWYSHPAQGIKQIINGLISAAVPH